MNNWFTDRRIPVHITDYTISSILSVLDTTHATTLISFINLATDLYISVHISLLEACRLSHSCKRFIPSEWIGDIDNFPLKPDYYATTREPFRQILKAQHEIEWTLFNVGWLADYFLPPSKTYMTPVPDKFPIDPAGWRACIRGTGDEVQSWLCGRDVGRAVMELCKADEWVSKAIDSLAKINVLTPSHKNGIRGVIEYKSHHFLFLLLPLKMT